MKDKKKLSSGQSHMVHNKCMMTFLQQINVWFKEKNKYQQNAFMYSL